jgi:hypothetical protein
MMSQCTICRTPTDLALSDVLTEKEITSLGGIDHVPLIGTCGERECIDTQLVRVNTCAAWRLKP